MVAPQGPAQSRQVGVVDRALRRVGGPVQVAQLHLDRLGPGGQAAAAEQRGRLGRPGHDAPARAQVVDRVEDRRSRAADHTAEQGEPARDRVEHAAGDHAGKVPDTFAHQVVGRDVLGHRYRRRRPGRRVALEVVDLGEHRGGPHAVGHRVAQVQQRGGLPAGQPLHQRHRPQRPGDVQRRLQEHLGEVEHLAQPARAGHPHPAHVEVEVEVRIDHPPRRGGGQGRHHHLLPQPQDLPGGVLEAGPEPLPVRGGVEDLQRHDPRTGARVGLTAVHEDVEGAEFGR